MNPPSIISIGYAKRALEPGSRERLRMQQYAAALNQYHVIVFTWEHEQFPAIQTDGNLTLYATNSKSRRAMLARAFRIGKDILAANQTKQFIVSSQDPFETSLIGRLLTYHTDHVHQVQIHGDVFNSRSYRSSVLQQIRVRYGRYVVRRTKCIRVVSERIKSSLLQLGVLPERVFVLPIQANLDQFIEVGKVREYDVTDVTLRLLYVGRLSREKNVKLLLDACAGLRMQRILFTLHIVGDGPEKEPLQSYTQTKDIADAVTFTGWHEAVVKEMQAANVFCLSSQHEGWAMVLQEAAAAGLPVMTTDVGCAGEYIRHEIEGLIVPVADTKQYISSLRALQDGSLRKKLGTAAFQKVVQTNIGQAAYVDKWVASHVPN